MDEVRDALLRLGLSPEEAALEAEAGMEEVREAIAEGDFFGAMTAFEEAFGLEPDCLMDIL